MRLAGQRAERSRGRRLGGSRRAFTADAAQTLAVVWEDGQVVANRGHR